MCAAPIGRPCVKPGKDHRPRNSSHCVLTSSLRPPHTYFSLSCYLSAFGYGEKHLTWGCKNEIIRSSKTWESRRGIKSTPFLSREADPVWASAAALRDKGETGGEEKGWGQRTEIKWSLYLDLEGGDGVVRCQVRKGGEWRTRCWPRKLGGLLFPPSKVNVSKAHKH